MRATYSPSIFGTHHIFSRQGLSSFSARRRRTVSRETLSCSVRRTMQFDGPASAALGRAGARGRDQKSFLLAGELALGAGTGLFMQGLPESALHEVALGPVDGGAPYTEALGNGLVRHPGVGRQQDLSSLELAGCMLATAEQRPKLRTLGFAQLDPITYVHFASPSREAQMNRLCDDVREKLHRAAGAILGLHRRLYPRPRPSPGRDRHAAPFPAQPAFRAPDGPHAGAPRPHPPPATRRAQHRGAPRPRRLARSPSPATSQIHCAQELVTQRQDAETLRSQLSVTEKELAATRRRLH